MARGAEPLLWGECGVGAIVGCVPVPHIPSVLGDTGCCGSGATGNRTVRMGWLCKKGIDGRKGKGMWGQPAKGGEVGWRAEVGDTEMGAALT